MKSLPGEDAVKIAEMAAKDSADDVNSGGKAAVGFERTHSNFEGGSTVGGMLSNSVSCCGEIVHERKSQPTGQTLLRPCFKKLLQPPQPSATATLISQRPSIWSQDPPAVKDDDS